MYDTGESIVERRAVRPTMMSITIINSLVSVVLVSAIAAMFYAAIYLRPEE
jgi:hypothetical protein